MLTEALAGLESLSSFMVELMDGFAEKQEESFHSQLSSMSEVLSQVRVSLHEVDKNLVYIRSVSVHFQIVLEAISKDTVG